MGKLGISIGLVLISSDLYTIKGTLGRGSSSTKICSNPCSQIAQAGIEPVARAGFVGKPSMDSDHHFIRLRCIIQSLVLVSKPQKLLLAITLADIGAERDKRSIDLIIHRIGLRHVRGTFDGDGSLVVCIGRGAPATVFLFNT